MFDLYVTFIVLTSLAAIASLAVALIAASHLAVPGARALTTTLAAASLWCGAYAGELASVSLAEKLFWAKLAYLGIVCVPPSWLLFCLAQFGRLRERRALTAALLYLVPAATLVFVLLAVRVPLVWRAVYLVPSGSHRMLMVDHGLWFWVHTAYSYLCLAGGSLLLLAGVLRRSRILSLQGITIALASILPWIANALTIFALVPIARLDLTPPAFVASALLIVVALRRLRLLDVFPGLEEIARERVVRELPEGVLVLDSGDLVLSANTGAATIFGRPPAKLAGRRLGALLAERGGIDLAAADLARSEDGPHEIRLGPEHGEPRILEAVAAPLGGTARRGSVLMLRDVTERVATLHALKDSEERLRVLFEQTPVAILVLDTDLVITECNERLAQLAGENAAHLLGQRLTSEHLAGLLPLVEAALRGESSHFDGPIADAAGQEHWLQCEVSPLRDAGGAVNGVICVAWDETQAKRAEALIERLAFHDSLTGLANRTLFRDRLRQALGGAGRSERRVALALLDLDRFRNVNDALGHNAADELLRDLAERLGAVLRRGDSIARVGGDEFAFILPGLRSASDALTLAEKILSRVREPWQRGERSFSVTGSLGLALYPSDADNAEGLLERAERALRRAKESGGDRSEFYDLTMNLQAAERLTMESALRVALAKKQFCVFYQPQVEITSGHIVGVEALVRWRHPERGLVPPGEFIPIAEETGLIGPIGEFVLSEACREVAACSLPLARELRLAVNVSPRQLQSGTLVAVVAAALEASGLAPSRLEIELTETAAITNLEATARVLVELHELGVSVALDDFGTGYASLSHLHRLPIDRVKLDRSFVSRLEEDEQAAGIVAAMLSLAQTLHLGTVGEGVETDGQLARLARLGCDEVQGFLFARPAPAEECAVLLTAGRSAPTRRRRQHRATR